MPRSRGGQSRATPARSAPTRPQAPTHALAPQQARQSSTAAHPGQAPPAQGSAGPGLFGQMASTAAGVAVGSSIGHAIGGFFGGGSSAAPAAEADPALQSSQYGANSSSSYNSNALGGDCSESAKAFTKCLDENKGEYQMSVCGWYLDQLKACQKAAAPY